MRTELLGGLSGRRSGEPKCGVVMPVERSWRLAVATVGQVQWELIEPLDEESVYARFLAERGEASTMSPSPLRTSTRLLRGPNTGTA
jgi:hypothetical protein